MIGVEAAKDEASKEWGSDEAHEIMNRSWRSVAMVLAGASTLRIAPPLIITRPVNSSTRLLRS
jgi:4-aminobutyrate aminotransferase-like enzyme